MKRIGLLGGTSWPSTLEYYRLLSFTQNINYLQMDRGRTADIRDGDAMDDLGGAFDELAHTAGIRCIGARHFPGLYSLPAVALGVFPKPCGAANAAGIAMNRLAYWRLEHRGERIAPDQARQVSIDFVYIRHTPAHDENIGIERVDDN